MWLLRLLLGGILSGLGWLRDLLVAAGRWLLSDWRNGPLLLFALGFAAHALLIAPNLRDERDAAKAAYATEVEAHNGTIAEFVMATRAAEKRQADNAARVRSEQAVITERTEHDFQTRLAQLRARHAALAGAVPGRLRGATAKVDPGAPGAARLPGDATAASLAGEAPGDNGLSLGQRLIASEQALQLDALIDWVLAQSEVKTSPAPENVP